MPGLIELLESLGWVLMVLAFAHAVFPRYFHWREELQKLSLVNKEIMEVHTLFIALTVGLMGLLLLTSAELLATTELGRRVAGGMALFWGVRLIVQFFGYSAELWKGKVFETAVHVCFTFLWLLLTLTLGWAAYFGLE